MKTLMVRAIGVLVLGLSWSGQTSASYVPPVFPGTGPYQRVYSDSGYSYEAASVYLPGTPQVKMAAGTGDTPYVYMGGWGNLSGAGAVDAGFQYSPTYNNWSLFESGAGHSQNNASGDRFSASQAVTLSFAVVASGTSGIVDLVVTASGLDGGNFGNGYHGNGQMIQESVTLAVSTATYGWSVGTGNENTLKRMTSIGQSKQNFLDGSYINGVAWSNVVLGQSALDAVAWSGGGSQSYPGTPNVVSVNYINAANETDSINLVPEPGSWAMLATSQVLGLGYFGWKRRQTRRATVAPST